MTDFARSRIAFLRERVAAASRQADRATFPVPFRQRQVDLVVTDVPIEFPLYNVLSGRTHRAQAEYIDRHGVSADFFAIPRTKRCSGRSTRSSWQWWTTLAWLVTCTRRA